MKSIGPHPKPPRAAPSPAARAAATVGLATTGDATLVSISGLVDERFTGAHGISYALEPPDSVTSAPPGPWSSMYPG